MAECFWPDVHEEHVEQAAERARRSAEHLSAEGTPVRYTGSILVPEDEVVFYLFDGASEQAVREVCELAKLPFERIVESVHGRGPGERGERS
jgi:hypothetical protein